MLTSTFSSLREIHTDFNYESDSGVSDAVYKTIAFFDIFDYPLTAWEVYKYLWKEELSRDISFLQLQNILDSHDSVDCLEGFYFLRGREDLVFLRKERYNIAARKYQRAGLAANILSLMPYVKMIAVSNSLSYDNARDNSDIDLFIIARQDKIWTARFFTTAFLTIFRLRPTEKSKKNAICLNFFISENALNVRNLRIEDDVYFIYWLKLLKPLYDDGRVFKDFCDANGWVNNYINSYDVCRTNLKRRIRHVSFFGYFKFIFEKILNVNFVENFLRKFQMNKLPSRIKEKANISSEVVVNDSMLKFHYQDKREKFRDEWRDRIKKYNSKVTN